MWLRFGALALCILLAACSSKPSRYALEQDVEPEGEFDVSQVARVQPKWEPLSRQGNASSYRVRGKRYHVMASDSPYTETGYASWYGLKFHNELTSNAERYDMYTFSAAHKSLPLPSYVRVTNLENQKQLIVRVNDRGPFHSDRIIDLSYAAAIQLGFKDQGTAKVKLERLMPQPPTKKVETTQPSHTNESNNADRLASFVQLGAFANHDSALALAKRAKGIVSSTLVFIGDSVGDRGIVYRVRVGPYNTEKSAVADLRRLERAGVGNPQLITRSVKAPES